MKTIRTLLIGFCTFLLAATITSAHVVVKPAEVGVAAYQTFTIGVPVEKEIATTGLRLMIPKGLENVSPNVKPGWIIEIKKDGDQVTEVLWSGGEIPPGQRDDFVFSAKAPAKESTLIWKAYQTYKDGSVVSWDIEEEHKEHVEETGIKGPASQTKVIDDLTSGGGEMSTKKNTQVNQNSWAFSIAAFAISLVALSRDLFKKK